MRDVGQKADWERMEADGALSPEPIRLLLSHSNTVPTLRRK
jgi:hypothetical protein